MTRLTAVTITKNEEAHIGRALASVHGLADEIIVVDAGSTDRTVEIARQFTEKVPVRPWVGYGPQKNFALAQANDDWVLFLDADEEVTAELANEIRRVVLPDPVPHLSREALAKWDAPPRSVYFIRIITEFLGKPLRHLWGTNPRLLRRGTVRWDDREVHEQVVRADGTTVRLGDPDTALLSSSLLHPSHYTTLRAYLERRELYTTRDAEEMRKTGRDRLGTPIGDPLRSPLSALRFLYERAAKQCVRLFFKKRGFLDGWQGLLWIWLSAQYEYIVAKKFLVLAREKRRVVGSV